MKYAKTFIKVEAMVLQRECIIDDLQQFNRENKGNQMLQKEVSNNKILIAKVKEELKLLYSIRNSFYV